MQSDNLEFCDRLNQILEGMDLSQKEFSKKIEIPYTTLNGYFTGRAEPDIKTIILLADSLDVSIEYLMAGRRTSHSVPLTQLAATLENPKLQDTYKKLVKLDPGYLELAADQLDAILKKQQNDNK